MRFTRIALLICLLAALAGSAQARRRHHRPRVMHMQATAYSVEGVTASGKWSKPGTAAADPAVLPLGSRIRIRGAGRYSGVYSVEDTGSKVDGRHIDLYMRSHAEAKRFGKQRVRVEVLEYGTLEAKR